MIDVAGVRLHVSHTIPFKRAASHRRLSALRFSARLHTMSVLPSRPKPDTFEPSSNQLADKCSHARLVFFVLTGHVSNLLVGCGCRALSFVDTFALPLLFFHFMGLLDGTLPPKFVIPILRKKTYRLVCHKHPLLDSRPRTKRSMLACFPFLRTFFPFGAPLSKEFLRGELDGREPFPFPVDSRFFVFQSTPVSSKALIFCCPLFTMFTFLKL